MTKGLRELLQMDTVGPTRIWSEGGKWYVLVIMDDFSCYSWLFSWRVRMRHFLMFEGLDSLVTDLVA